MKYVYLVYDVLAVRVIWPKVADVCETRLQHLGFAHWKLTPVEHHSDNCHYPAGGGRSRENPKSALARRPHSSFRQIRRVGRVRRVKWCTLSADDRGQSVFNHRSYGPLGSAVQTPDCDKMPSAWLWFNFALNIPHNLNLNFYTIRRVRVYLFLFFWRANQFYNLKRRLDVHAVIDVNIENLKTKCSRDGMHR